MAWQAGFAGEQLPHHALLDRLLLCDQPLKCGDQPVDIVQPFDNRSLLSVSWERYGETLEAPISNLVYRRTKVFINLSLEAVRLEEVAKIWICIGAKYAHECTECLANDTAVEHHALANQTTTPISNTKQNVLVTHSDAIRYRTVHVHIILKGEPTVLDVGRP